MTKTLMVLSFGFTGTRKGMSQPQKDFLTQLLARHSGQFHHGDCVGADAEAHDIAHGLGYRLVGHPPMNPSNRAYKKVHQEHQPLPYHVRNAQIVLSCDVLIAAPHSDVEVGGTWNTINFFRRFMEGHATCGKQGYIVLPSGQTGAIITQKRGGLNGTPYRQN